MLTLVTMLQFFWILHIVFGLNIIELMKYYLKMYL